MDNNRLQVTRVESTKQQPPPIQTKATRRQEVEATMERMWLNDPDQFNPDRDAVQRKRVNATIRAIKKNTETNGKRCADLGCGSGTITRSLRDAGAKIDSVDISGIALKLLKSNDMQNITAIQDCMPTTRLDDNAYDIVICTEMIGFLQPKEYRMLFAELARLINKEGIVACSSSLELKSENALERFAALAETEFEIDEWILRYDLLWLRFCRFFESPAIFIKAGRDLFERNKELDKRKSLRRLWFKLNTSQPLILFWRIVNMISGPVAAKLRQSDRLVDFLETITKFIWDESGISHALFIGKRRPMTFPLPANEVPVEIKHKREVWN
ncbi:MAG TPA: class I SAM-dependent methyltransferase [Parachlamydiaceae bacterium]|nr:class I SAM-dependent methyltransferase [Parachlamydiaceae bacterium]